MAGIKIVDLPPLGRDLASTDLLELSLAGGTGSRKITGQEIMNTSKLNIGTTAITSGVVGRVLFEGAGNVVQQSSSLFWDATNNRLGIGTSAPGASINILANDVQENLWNDRYVGTNGAAAPAVILRKARGTISSPTAALSGDPLGVFGFRGYGSTAFSSGSRAYLAAYAGENWTDSAQGTFFAIGTTANGTNSASIKMQILGNGNVGIGTTTDAGFRLDVNGTARVIGVGTTSATTSFQVVNSAGLVPFRILGNGNVEMPFSASLQFDFTCRRIASNGGNGSQGLILQSQNYGNASGTAVTINYFGSPAGAISNALVIGGPNLQSSTYNSIIVGGDFSSSVGTNSIVGYLFNPTLNGTFSAANTIAIHTVTGNVLLGTTSGNVGIGTTSPSQKLDVNGSAIIKGGLSVNVSSPQFTTVNAASGNKAWSWIMSGNDLYIREDGIGFPFQFKPGGNIIANQSGGNFLINTTTDAGFRLDVNGTIRSNSTITGNNLTSVANVLVGAILYGTNFSIATNGQTSFGAGGFNAPASALVAVTSTTQGFLPPRMTQAQRNAIASPAIGLEIYQTDATEGKYIYKSSGWTYIG